VRRASLSPLRINIVSGPFYPSPPAPTGAVQRIWFDLAKHFVQRGHTVEVQSCGYSGFPRDATVDGIRIRRFVSLKHTRRTVVNLLKDFVYSIRVLASLPRADVTITNCFWLPAVMTRLPGRRRWGSVYVCVQRVPKGQMGLYSRVDRLHAVSSAIAKWIADERPASAARTRVIPNPIDVRHFHANDGLARSPEPASRPVVMFTGRVHPEKGLDILVRAMPILRQAVPGASLRVIGPTDIDKGGGGPTYVEQLRALAHDQPVSFEPAIYDRAALAAALRSADVYCYPSVAEKGEASPVAPLEAMGVGLVPVCSDLPQYRDYLEEGMNGVTFDHRAADAPERLARALADLLTNPERRREMALAAARTGAAHSNEAIADRFLADFATLMEEGRS
jgi:glycosyltransferase involved in cell wall biosynthesis